MIKRIKLINILLILLIFPAAAFLVRDYMLYRLGPKKTALLQAPAAAPAAASDIMRYAGIVKNPVFPSASRSLVALSSSPRDAGAADNSAIFNELKLIGTYVGPVSFAVFEKKDGQEQKAVKKGETLYDAGTVKEIQNEGVVILSGSREFTFRMPEAEMPAVPPISGLAAGPPPVTREAAPKPVNAGAQGRAEMSRKTGDNAWVIDQKAVLNALNDISQVLSDARLTPVQTKGTVDGFLVAEIRPRGIFDAIGLKNGDVLKRVNGYDITSPEKAVQVLSALKGETRIDLDVVRDGKKMNFHYEIK